MMNNLVDKSTKLCYCGKVVAKSTYAQKGERTLSERMFIGRKMMIINKYFKIYLRNALKEYDLNAMEGMVLLVLYENNNHLDKDTFDKIHNILGKTQEQIISELHYDKSIMARTMQSLEKAVAFKPVLIGVLKKWSEILLNEVENLDMVAAALDKMSQNVILNIKGEL